jgi:hypothetical protein
MRRIATIAAAPWAPDSALEKGSLILSRRPGCALILGGMLYESYNSCGHEAPRAYDFPIARYFGDLDGSAHVRYLDAPPRLCGGDLICLCALAYVDDDFDSVASHGSNRRTGPKFCPGFRAWENSSVNLQPRLAPGHTTSMPATASR